MNKTNLSSSTECQWCHQPIDSVVEEVSPLTIMEEGEKIYKAIMIDCTFMSIELCDYDYALFKTYFAKMVDSGQPDTTTQGDDSKLQDVLNVLKIMPHGAIYEANRYDTDDKHVLHVWVKEQNTKMFGTISFDISVPKDGTVVRENRTAGDEQIQTKDLVSIDKKIDTNLLDTRLDSSTLGVDSMKEKILAHAYVLYKHQHTPEAFTNVVMLLFQSQESKTLERVREEIGENYKKFDGSEQDWPQRFGYNAALDDVLAILEAEKGSK